MVDRFGRFSLALFEISRHWYRLAGEEMARYGLKAPHAIYLTVLYRSKNGLTGPELCRRCGRDKSDVSRTLAVLEEKGFVRKEVVNGSLYRGLLRLTEAGRTAAEHVCLRASQVVEQAGRGLTAETRALFYEALESIAAHLREMEREGVS